MISPGFGLSGTNIMKAKFPMNAKKWGPSGGAMLCVSTPFIEALAWRWIDGMLLDRSLVRLGPCSAISKVILICQR